jgi:hypothetical protein
MAMHFRADEVITIAAVRQDGGLLQHAVPALCANRQVMRAAVSQNGWALRFAVPKLRADFDLVSLAIKRDRSAAQYASLEIRDNREIMLPLVHGCGGAIQYLGPGLLGDSEVVSIALRTWCGALRFAAAHLQKDNRLRCAAKRQVGLAGLVRERRCVENDRRHVHDVMRLRSLMPLPGKGTRPRCSVCGRPFASRCSYLPSCVCLSEEEQAEQQDRVQSQRRFDELVAELPKLSRDRQSELRTLQKKLKVKELPEPQGESPEAARSLALVVQTTALHSQRQRLCSDQRRIARLNCISNPAFERLNQQVAAAQSDRCVERLLHRAEQRALKVICQGRRKERDRNNDHKRGSKLHRRMKDFDLCDI